MRKYNLISVFVLCAFFAQAQLSLSSPSIDFGDVLTTEEKEIAVDVTNENTYPVKVDQTKLYSSLDQIPKIIRQLHNDTLSYYKI